MEDLSIGLIEVIQHVFEMFIIKPGDPSYLTKHGSIYWLELITKLLLLITALLSAYFWGRRVLKAKIQQILIDPDAFWNKKTTSNQRSAYKKQINASIPVIAIANYKGGVGKSMISANLAAYFDKAGARVLLIDYDYQGSLTDIVPYTDRENITFSAQYILEGRSGIHDPEKLGRSFRNTYIQPAETGLSRVDSKIVFDWLVGARKEDIRFHTHEYLSQPEIQNNFDLVIIDSPPRLSAATANALCAATHVLIPAILDTVTSRTVIRTLDMFRDFRNSLGLSFKFLGVVPSHVQSNARYAQREQAALTYLKQEIETHFRDMKHPDTNSLETIEVLEQQPIMHKVGLLHIDGDDLAFFNPNPRPYHAIITQMFTRLGNVIVHKIVKHQGCRFSIASKGKSNDHQGSTRGPKQPQKNPEKLADQQALDKRSGTA